MTNNNNDNDLGINGGIPRDVKALLALMTALLAVIMLVTFLAHMEAFGLTLEQQRELMIKNNGGKLMAGKDPTILEPQQYVLNDGSGRVITLYQIEILSPHEIIAQKYLSTVTNEEFSKKYLD